MVYHLLPYPGSLYKDAQKVVNIVEKEDKKAEKHGTYSALHVVDPRLWHFSGGLKSLRKVGVERTVVIEFRLISGFP